MAVEDYRRDPTFNPGIVGILDKASHMPVPVSVTGIEGIDADLCGIGQAVGSVELGGGERDIVIELKDATDGTTHTLRGVDCRWAYPPDADTVRGIADGTVALGSVRRYLSVLYDERARSDAAYRAWLEGLSTDPYS